MPYLKRSFQLILHALKCTALVSMLLQERIQGQYFENFFIYHLLLTAFKNVILHLHVFSGSCFLFECPTIHVYRNYL